MHPKPFTVHVPDVVIEDLRARLARTRWPDPLPYPGWTSGGDLDYLRELVDYWAVDWDFKGDTFHNQWQTYRTRKDPKKIELGTEYSYPESGKHTIVVKVIDILGNDTTKTVEVTVK